MLRPVFLPLLALLLLTSNLPGQEPEPPTAPARAALEDCGPIVITIQLQGLPPSINGKELLSHIDSLMKEKKIPLATEKAKSKSILRITVSANASREVDLYGIYMAIELVRPVQLTEKSRLLAIFWQVNSVSLASTKQARETVETYLLTGVKQFIEDYLLSNP